MLAFFQGAWASTGPEFGGVRDGPVRGPLGVDSFGVPVEGCLGDQMSPIGKGPLYPMKPYMVYEPEALLGFISPLRCWEPVR